MRTARGEASPSLALIKYWGKQAGGTNIPATTSIAVGLDALRTVTFVREAAEGEVLAAGQSRATGQTPATGQSPAAAQTPATGQSPAAGVSIDGKAQPGAPFLGTIDTFRALARQAGHRCAECDLVIESTNSFPTAAGIASSSSGFAALVLALNAFFALELSPLRLSALAREGSGSAARSVYDGFTRFDAGAEAATRLYPADHWPELRVLVAVTDTGAKGTGSRDGMERTRRTSPYYDSWVADSFSRAELAASALTDRDLSRLGPIMRESYLRMTGSMLAAAPPVVYWLPESVGLIRLCERLRADGIPAWETMDAGPQVKILTTDAHLATVGDAVRTSGAAKDIFETPIGGPAVSALEQE